MMKFAGIMRDIDPKGIAQYQIQASRLKVSGNDVLQAVDNENMRAILKIFQGQAPLAGAPAQVIDTSTTTTAKATTTSGSTTTSAGTATTGPATSTPAGATTTVVGPEEIVKGDILPDKNVTC